MSIVEQENQMAVVFNSIVTLRRSPPEQYSMISRGKLFNAID